MTEANPDSACVDRLSFRPNSGRIPPIRVMRAIRGEVISAFPRRVFGNADHSGADRTSDQAGAARE